MVTSAWRKRREVWREKQKVLVLVIDQEPLAKLDHRPMSIVIPSGLCCVCVSTRCRVRLHLPQARRSEMQSTTRSSTNHRWALIRLRQRMRMGLHFGTRDEQLENHSPGSWSDTCVTDNHGNKIVSLSVPPVPGPFEWMSANRRMSANSLGRSKVPVDDPTTMDKLRKDRKFLCGNHIDYTQIFSICLAAGNMWVNEESYNNANNENILFWSSFYYNQNKIFSSL